MPKHAEQNARKAGPITVFLASEVVLATAAAAIIASRPLGLWKWATGDADKSRDALEHGGKVRGRDATKHVRQASRSMDHHQRITGDRHPRDVRHTRGRG